MGRIVVIQTKKHSPIKPWYATADLRWCMGAAREIPPLVVRRADEGRRLGRIRLQMIESNLGEVCDVSATGARLVWSGFRAPRVSDYVRLRIDGLDGPIELDARIIWTRRAGILRHDVGVEFQQPSLAAKQGLVTLVRRAPMNEIRVAVGSIRRSA